MTTSYHIPARPYTPIDALNRSCAALGSPRYAQGASNANYNGHRVHVYWNDYRRYYVCDYTWAGRNVLARGSFAACLAAALFEQGRGALGSETHVSLRPGDTEAQALCDATAELVSGEAPSCPDWYTWKHSTAAQCARDSACPGRPTMIFDWELLQAAESNDAYTNAVKAKHGRVYT